MAPRQGRQGHGQLSTDLYLYVSFKQNSGERFRATWPSCLLFLIEKNRHGIWGKRQLFSVGNVAEIRPLEKGRKSPVWAP